MREKELTPQPERTQIETAKIVSERHQEILDKVNSGVKPEDLAQKYDLESLAELLNAVGLLFGTSQGDDRLIYMKRYRTLEKAWRLKAIESEDDK